MKKTARSRARRILGTALLLAGALILLWFAADALDRRAAQRRGLQELRERAELGAAEVPAVTPGRAPAAPAAPAPPAPGELVARISIPEAGVDTAAFEGIDRKTLKRGAGHFPGTALPGQRGNSSFAAHRDSFFRGLREVEIGDRVEVETGADGYVYRVSDLRVVEPSQVDVIAARGGSELTLVTCHPFDYVGPAPRRFVVHAELVGPLEAPGVAGSR